ncbi:MAG: hypothetical protein NTAFB09_05110 [Nitrosospira sp.]
MAIRSSLAHCLDGISCLAGRIEIMFYSSFHRRFLLPFMTMDGIGARTGSQDADLTLRAFDNYSDR